MNLHALQAAFRNEIVADDEGVAPSSPGMAIYRDAYRGRLLGALETSFARTRRWTGAPSFTAAACHYILTRPPTGWTLDTYGASFPELLSSLFADDPEVAELAWLEWQIDQAFAAPDRPTFDPATFAACGQGDIAWDNVRFTMAAGFAMRPVTTDCVTLWDAMSEEQQNVSIAAVTAPAWLMVWRVGFNPCHRTVDPAEAEALSVLTRGGTLGSLTTDCDASRLGDWLLQWFGEGIFSTVA